MDLALSGLASNFDWNSFIDQMTEIERAPQTALRKQQTQYNDKNTAFGSLKTQLEALQTKIVALKSADLFDARAAMSSDPLAATATAASGTALGAFSFSVKNLAASAALRGAANIGKSLATSDDVSGLSIAEAAFSLKVTGGTFTVNGKQVSIATTDTLQGVFQKISDATSGAVQAAYDSASDRITLSSAAPIVLGSATDSSNFLQAARLTNNGSGSISSYATLGSVRSSVSLANANFETAVTDGGAGAGEFMVNGVSIKYNASVDSVSTVLDRINNSAAGVSAGYDAVNDRFVLTNKATGDIGVGVSDVTGNFVTASGLANGTLERGKNLVYTVNGSGELTSQSNTITAESSGINGLSVSVLKEGAVSITVNSDQAKIKNAINEFVTEYNKTQSLIQTKTASSTDAKGVVTAGILASDSTATELSSRLRKIVSGDAFGISGLVRRLENLGFTSNGNDDSLATGNGSALENALTNNLAAIKDFFTNPEKGFATSLETYLKTVVGENGSLAKHQDNLTAQSGNIDKQIQELERWVQVRRKQMLDSFVAMESAQQKINQQLSFLQQQQQKW